MTTTLESISHPFSETKKITSSSDFKICILALYLMNREKPKKLARHSSILHGAKSLRHPLATRCSIQPVNYIKAGHVALTKLPTVAKTSLSLHELVASKSKSKRKVVKQDHKIESVFSNSPDDLLKMPSTAPSSLSEATIKSHANTAMKMALEEELGPCTLEISDKKADQLPPNSVEIHFERLSPSEIRLTARVDDEAQSMLTIIFDLIRLGIKHEEVDRLYRDQLQTYMILHMEKVTENLLNQSKMILTASIAAGVTGMVGGLLPIVGILKGNAILKKLSKIDWFSSLKDAKQEKVFMSFSRTLDSASRTTEMANRAQTTQADGLKYQEEGKSKVFEIKQSESTQSLRDRGQRKDSYFSMLDRIIDRWYQFFQSLCR